MKTILFTWNPQKWQWHDLPQAIVETNMHGKHIDRWSCGVTRNINIGDRAFLMRLGLPPKGIIGSGFVKSSPEEGPHWDSDRAAKGDKVYYVNILFDILSDTPVLGEDALSSPELQNHNFYPHSSGTSVPENIAGHLELLWSEVTGIEFVPLTKEEIQKIFLEGPRRSRIITVCERNSEARSKCIEHYNVRCKVCGLAFNELYGEIGKGFIHIHHLMPIAERCGEHKVDPIKDLRPVCPNCHSMLHKRIPPYSIEELIQIIVDAKK